MNGNERELKVSSLLATPEQPSSCPAKAGNPAAPYHWDEKDNHVKHLASLLRLRNTIDKEIAAVIGRLALTGHFGEFIAAQVFNVGLHDSAVQKGSNGRFTNAPHTGKTVDIRYYPKLEGLLDMKTDSQPDFYLVLTGPRGNAAIFSWYDAPLDHRIGLPVRCRCVHPKAYREDRNRHQRPAQVLGRGGDTPSKQPELLAHPSPARHSGAIQGGSRWLTRGNQ